MNFFERKYNVSRLTIWETARETATSIEAAEKLGIPYKAFIKIAKEMNVFKETKTPKDVSLKEILEGKHPGYSTTRLKERLLNEKGWEYVCNWCKISEWRGQRLVLQLDHIDGNNSNHKIENLRLLCPNCHSQTETYAGNNNSSL